jgi:hypothetical protein
MKESLKSEDPPFKLGQIAQFNFYFSFLYPSFLCADPFVSKTLP